MEIRRTNFRNRNNYFSKVPISHIIQNHWKDWLCFKLFSFNLTVEYPIIIYNFCLLNCLWTTNAYSLVVQKVFMFQMSGETFIFKLPGKVPLWRKFQNVLCGNMNMDVSLTCWILNSFSPMTSWIHVGLLQSKSEMIYFPKKFCLMIVHTQHIF